MSVQRVVFSAFTDAASQFPEGFKEYDCMLDRDCPLNNLTTSKVEASIASLKECKKRCDADDVRETCKSFVWNEDDKMCYLKNTVCTTENSTALPTISTVYCAGLVSVTVQFQLIDSIFRFQLNNRFHL